jgi:hypothetical protein
MPAKTKTLPFVSTRSARLPLEPLPVLSQNQLDQLWEQFHRRIETRLGYKQENFLGSIEGYKHHFMKENEVG